VPRNCSRRASRSSPAADAGRGVLAAPVCSSPQGTNRRRGPPAVAHRPGPVDDPDHSACRSPRPCRGSRALDAAPANPLAARPGGASQLVMQADRPRRLRAGTAARRAAVGAALEHRHAVGARRPRRPGARHAVHRALRRSRTTRSTRSRRATSSSASSATPRPGRDRAAQPGVTPEPRFPKAERLPKEFWQTPMVPVLEILVPDQPLEEGAPWGLQILVRPIPTIRYTETIESVHQRLAPRRSATRSRATASSRSSRPSTASPRSCRPCAARATQRRPRQPDARRARPDPRPHAAARDRRVRAAAARRRIDAAPVRARRHRRGQGPGR
jgi:hypothetical protein